MNDSVIDEMGQRILDWRHKVGHGIHQADVERWARHLRDIVQPQLDELEQLKATMAKKGKSTAVTA